MMIIMAVLLIRYSGPFVKWTREELQQMDQRKRKLMTMNKAIHPRDVIENMCQEKEDSPALKTVSINRYNDSKTIYKKKQ